MSVSLATFCGLEGAAGPAPGDYLFYSEWRKRGKVHKARPKEPKARQTLHRWWYEHLQRAGRSLWAQGR